MEEKIDGVLNRLGSVESFLSEIFKEKDGQIEFCPFLFIFILPLPN